MSLVSLTNSGGSLLVNPPLGGLQQINLSDYIDLYEGSGNSINVPVSAGTTSILNNDIDMNIYSSLTSGITGGYVNTVGSDACGNIYFGGPFTTAGEISASRIAKWNGSAWSALGGGTNDEVIALAFDENNNVYAGGNFSNPGNAIAKWNGSTWASLGGDVGNGGVYALAYDGAGNLYVGGSFTTAGGSPASKIAKWNIATSTWSALGNGLNDNVFALALDGSGNLYAGGNFTIADGSVNAERVAKWDGSSWSALGLGVDSTVYALAVDTNNILYAGGNFTIADGSVNASRIAKWDGSSWSALGLGVNNLLLTLAVDSSNNLYAGGFFTTAGSVNASRIAKWNGSVWSALGLGTDGNNCQVRGLTYSSNGKLYLGGIFTTAGGSSAVNAASYGPIDNINAYVNSKFLYTLNQNDQINVFVTNGGVSYTNGLLI